MTGSAWLRQPDYLPPINARSLLANQLIYAWLPNGATPYGSAYVLNPTSTRSNTLGTARPLTGNLNGGYAPGRYAGMNGRAPFNNDSINFIDFDTSTYVAGQNTWSAMAVVSASSLGSLINIDTTLFGMWPVPPGPAMFISLVWQLNGSSQIYFTARGWNTLGLITASGLSFAAANSATNYWVVIARVGRDNTNTRLELFVNGGLQGSSVSTTPLITYTPAFREENQVTARHVCLTTTAGQPGLLIHGLAGWNRALTGGEILSLTANPWQIYAKPDARDALLNGLPALNAARSLDLRWDLPPSERVFANAGVGRALNGWSMR